MLLKTDYKVGFGGVNGLQKDRMDKSSVGWDHVEKVDKHSSQIGKDEILEVIVEYTNHARTQCLKICKNVSFEFTSQKILVLCFHDYLNFCAKKTT